MKMTHNLTTVPFKQLWALVVATLFTVQVNAQAINEGFEDILTLTASGWVQNNLSGPVVGTTNWNQGNVSIFPAFAGAGYISANYENVDNVGDISNWLISPNRTFNNGDIITFYTRTGSNPTTFADNLQVRFSAMGTSTNVGTTSASVGDFTDLLLEINPTLSGTVYPAVWTQYSITISGLAGPTSGRVAFRYFVTNSGFNGANGDYIGIDQFVYTPSGAGTAEVYPTEQLLSPYTIIPNSQAAATYPVSVNLTNSGVVSAASVNVTTKVYQAPNFITAIQTLNGSTTNLAAGASVMVNMGNFNNIGVGGYLFEHIITGNTGSVANDTAYTSLTISNNYYARDDNNVTARFGIGAGPVGYIGSMYNITSNTVLDSVLIALIKFGTDNVSGDGVGDSTRITVFNVAGGLPNTIIGRSPKKVFTPADTLGLVVSQHKINAVGGGQLVLTPGMYYIAVTEYNTNVGMAVCDGIFSTNSVYAGWTGNPFTAVENFGAAFSKTPVIRPYLVSACAITSTTSSTNATCTGGNGSATVTPAGGTAPYTYIWSNGAITATANNLVAATYTVTVTDASACASTATVTVSSNTVVLAATNTTTNSDCGATTGSASVNPTNGTLPYSYNWSNGGNTQTINNIGAGSYSVTITDANGCMGTITGIVVNNPNAPTASISASTNVLCNGNTTGSATANAAGGTAPYTFSWSNGANTATANNLAANTYTVTITDAASCAATTNIVITEPTALTASTNAVATMDVACNGGNDGMAGVTAAGGTSAYTYMWSNSATTADITGLTAGTYNVTVMDANNCNATHSVVVGQPAAALTIPVTHTDVSCNSGSNGSASVTATGGTAPYSYTWSNGAITASATGLVAGTYDVTVTDANGCMEVSTSSNITEPAAMATGVTATDASVAGSADGAVDIAVSGGTAPYSFVWSNGATTEDISGVLAGTYTVTITDANGCTDVHSGLVQDGPVAIGMTNGDINITVFPNPAADKATLSIELVNMTDVTIQINNVIGQVMQSINAADVTNNQFNLDMSEWASGVYFVRVTAGEETATYRLTKK